MIVSDDLLRLGAVVALAGTVACAPLVWLEVRTAWGGLNRTDRRWLLGLLAFAALLLILVPGRMVQVFTGYGLLDDIAMGRAVPRYGAGQGVVLAPLFALFGAGESVAFAANAVAGWLSMGLAALLFATWTGRPKAMLWAMASVLVVPLLLRHHRSEAAAVLGTPALLLSVLHALRAARPGGLLRDVVGASFAAAFAGHVRPEFAVAAPALAIVAAWMAGEKSKSSSRPMRLTALCSSVLPGVLLLAPQWVHLGRGLVVRHATGDLPVTESSAWLKLPVMLVSHNLAFWPHVFPLALTVLAIWAAGRCWTTSSHAARLARWLPLAVLLLMAPTMVDPPDVSLPRLQATPLLILTAAGACLAEHAWPRPLQRGLLAVVVVVAASAAATTPWHVRTDNSDHEAAFLDAASTELAGRRGVLHMLLPGDAGHDKVSRHHPGYRFRRPWAALQVERLGDVPSGAHADGADLPVGQERFILLGVRCYAHVRPQGASPPPRWQQADCARIRARNDLKTLLRFDVANRGDVHFPWWPAQDELELRLYRVDRASPD